MKRQQSEGQPPAPDTVPMRTFVVSVERFHPEYHVDQILVQAAAYVIDRDTVSFVTQDTLFDGGEWVTVQRYPRTLRPFLDIEEVFEQATSSGRAN